MTTIETMGSVGEKNIIRSVIRPLLNPEDDLDLVGDDCGVFWTEGAGAVCVSTDRVPWDLTAFRLGIMDLNALGYYLAVLNLSDQAAMGARPMGIVLNIATPADFLVSDLALILSGADSACREYGCRILGGDLSDSVEPSLAATSVGFCERPLRRVGSQIGDTVYCTALAGLTATAFRYFLEAKPAGLSLPRGMEEILETQFTRPIPALGFGRALAASGARATAMDNTDGFGQTLSELAELNDLGYEIDTRALAIEESSYLVAAHLGVDVTDVVLGPGADFQLIGTVEAGRTIPGLRPIGRVVAGPGRVLIRRSDGTVAPHQAVGWNYFLKPATR